MLYLKSVYGNKTVLSYPGQPSKTSARSLPCIPIWPHNVVPRQVVTHMQNIGNNWVVEFLTLKRNEDSDMIMNSSSLIPDVFDGIQ